MTRGTIVLIALLIRHGRGMLTALERWNVENEERLDKEDRQK